MTIKLPARAWFPVLPLGNSYCIGANGRLSAAPMNDSGEINWEERQDVSESAFGSDEELARFASVILHFTGWAIDKDYTIERVPRKKFLADEFYSHLSNFLSAGEALSAYWEEYGQGDNDPKLLLPFTGYPFLGTSFDDVVAGIRKWKETVYNRIVNEKEARDASHL